MSGDWVTKTPAAFNTTVSSTAMRPSRTPEFVASISIICSAILALATAPQASIEALPGLGVVAASLADRLAGVVARDVALISVVGYGLTPFSVVAALAWARISGLKRLDDPWFDRVRLRQQTRTLQVLAVLSFMLAVPHVIIVARAIQKLIGLES